MNTAFGFPQFILDQFIQVFKQYPEIDSAVIYGSRAKGNFREGSDIDLGLFAPTLSREKFAKISSALEDLPIIFNFDCVHVDTLKREALINKIKTEGKVIYLRGV